MAGERSDVTRHHRLCNILVFYAVVRLVDYTSVRLDSLHDDGTQFVLSRMRCGIPIARQVGPTTHIAGLSKSNTNVATGVFQSNPLMAYARMAAIA